MQRLDRSKLIQMSCPTFGEWYERFGLGMHKRMGDVVRPDIMILVEVMGALMEDFEKDWVSLTEKGDEVEELGKILFPALFAVMAYIVAYVVALRGEEAPLMDLMGMMKHFARAIRTTPNEDGEELSHVVIALLGCCKGEKGEKYHYTVSGMKTRKSDLEPAKWISRMPKWHKDRGVKNGPVFRKKIGKRGKG